MSRIGIAGTMILFALAAAASAQQKTDSTAPKATTTSAPAAKATTSTATVTAGKATATGATVTAGTAKASAKAPAAPKGGPQMLVGEIVDPACYLINGAHGEPHKECAIACAKAGQGLALLEKKTNKLYLLCTEQPGQDPNATAINYVAQMVIVKGIVRTRGGALGVQVDSLMAYSAAKAGGK